MSNFARPIALSACIATALCGGAMAQTPSRPSVSQDQNALPTEMMMLPRAGSTPSVPSAPTLVQAPIPQAAVPAVPAAGVVPPAAIAPGQAAVPQAALPQTLPTTVPPAPGQPGVPGQAVAGQPAPPSMSQQAFQQAIDGLLPLNPEMLGQFNRTLDSNRRAAVVPTPGSTNPTTRSIQLNLRPGEALPRLNMAAGNVSTLVFADMTGAPWPVQSVTVANSDAYQAVAAGTSGPTNMVVISPKQHYASANNLVVTLVGHPVPIVFSLDTGGRSVDYRVDVSIRARGPNAMVEVSSGSVGLAPTDDSVMRAFSDGTPPRGARRMEASNRDVEVWRFNDNLYIRTPMQLLSPAWIGSMSHPTGFRVYSIPDGGRASLPVLYVSQGGRTSFVTVSEGNRR